MSKRVFAVYQRQTRGITVSPNTQPVTSHQHWPRHYNKAHGRAHSLLIQVGTTAILEHRGEGVNIDLKNVEKLHNPRVLHFSVNGVLPRDVLDVRVLSLVSPGRVELMHLYRQYNKELPP